MFLYEALGTKVIKIYLFPFPIEYILPLVTNHTMLTCKTGSKRTIKTKIEIGKVVTPVLVHFYSANIVNTPF